MKIHTATVLRRRMLSPRLASVTLGGLENLPSTAIPDEYVRLMFAPAGHDLVLPRISDDWEVIQPAGTTAPIARVYTISDYRLVDGAVELDIDIAVHENGPGAAWARTCRPGEQVGVTEPHGLYAASPEVGWQLLVADMTGVPALGRILRGLEPSQRARAVVVVTDLGDQIPLPSAAEVDIEWVVVGDATQIGAALESAVTTCHLPERDRYVWLAGEARASRAVRRFLRRELGWPQADFYTCGYWQYDAERWSARYAEVAADVMAKADKARAEIGDDEGLYLDALDEIYESAGL